MLNGELLTQIQFIQNSHFTDKLLGGVAVVDAAQIVEASDHQSRTGQKDDGERELRHHYRAAEPPHA